VKEEPGIAHEQAVTLQRLVYRVHELEQQLNVLSSELSEIVSSLLPDATIDEREAFWPTFFEYVDTAG
jgi:hypothetical protein